MKELQNMASAMIASMSTTDKVAGFLQDPRPATLSSLWHCGQRCHLLLCCWREQQCVVYSSSIALRPAMA